MNSPVLFIRRGLVLVLCAGLFAAAAVALGAGASVTFRFNPPDKTTYTESYTTSLTRDAGKGQKVTQRGEVVARKVITKTPSGFRLVSTRVSSRLTQDGKRLPDPMNDTLVGAKVTYEFDRTGRLTAIRGYDVIASRLRSAMDASTVKTQGAAYRENALVRRATADWEQRSGALIGKTLTVGSGVVTVDLFPLATGKHTPVYTVRRIAAKPKFSGHDCVEIRSDSNTDAQALARATGLKVQTILSAKPPKGTALDRSGKVRIRSRSTLVVDPATMLSYSEATSRTLTAPGQKGSVTINESSTYTFSYGK